MDKAGTAYWESVWASSALRRAVDPELPGLRNYVNRQFDLYFRKVFAGLDTNSKRLLEIGCGNSGWLPYFAKSFGFDIYGLDYSQFGCEQERQILRRDGISGSIVCADMFSPPADMLRAFDVVVSIGVAEHFENTKSCIGAIASFAKPGGLVITIIPNMVGAVGIAQKLLNRPVFDIHVPVDAEMLGASHQAANCSILDCDYFLSTDFGVCTLKGIATTFPAAFLKKLVLAALVRISMIAWLVEIPTTKFMSPYINCVAQVRG
jgi:2-polyprenyl-3-methyl-5-hydroxy-6-metoxy-1,4-benzoquinol methylase